MRGSIRNVIVIDSEFSVLPATDASSRRTSGLFSAQKSASASSLSKIGTSSHLAIARMFRHRVFSPESPIGSRRPAQPLRTTDHYQTLKPAANHQSAHHWVKIVAGGTP